MQTQSATQRTRLSASEKAERVRIARAESPVNDDGFIASVVRDIGCIDCFVRVVHAGSDIRWQIWFHAEISTRKNASKVCLGAVQAAFDQVFGGASRSMYDAPIWEDAIYKSMSEQDRMRNTDELVLPSVYVCWPGLLNTAVATTSRITDEIARAIEREVGKIE